MRRKDKEITDVNEIGNIIREAVVCRLGLIDGDSPYIVPMNFGYKDNALYFHSAAEGRKIDILRSSGTVCFEMDIPGKIVTNETACGWTMNYRSVIGKGKAVLLEDSDQKKEALNIIMQHYSGKNEWEYSEKMLDRIIIIKLEIAEITAKKSDK